MDADEARRLRRDEGLSVAQIQRRLGVGKHVLTDWLRGIPAPAWTARPNAKDDLRARAIELRGQGWSVNDIALELGVAKSTAWTWVRHQPLDPDSARAEQRRAHAKAMNDRRWEGHRADRDAARAEVMAAAAAEVGELTQRDLTLLGAAIYWCEGAKSKPWRRAENLQFTNSDPGLLGLFLRFLRACAIPPDAMSFRVHIHESADAEAAAQWWAERLRLDPARFRRPTVKRHRPSTTRHNLGDDYHGCLVVYVQRTRRLYWRVEGMVQAITESAR